MKQHRIKKNMKLLAIFLFASVFFSSFKQNLRQSVPVPASRITLISDSASDDTTFNSPEMDSLLLIIAITVLGLTSVIGYYIVTNRKGPH